METQQSDTDLLDNIIQSVQPVQNFISSCNWRKLLSFRHRVFLPLKFEREEDEIV